MSDTHRGYMVERIRQLVRIEEEATKLVEQFDAIAERQRKLLVEGQTLESASKNWDAATLGPGLDFGPLKSALKYIS